MKQILQDISDESDFDIIVMETDEDHVYLMLDYPPTLSVLQMVNRLKSVSTVRIWKSHPNFLSHHFFLEGEDILERRLFRMFYW